MDTSRMPSGRQEATLWLLLLPVTGLVAALLHVYYDVSV